MPEGSTDQEMGSLGSSVTVTEGAHFTIVTGTEADDPISRSLAAGIYPSLDLFHLLTELAPPGGRVLDLGAHVGMFSLAAAAAGYQVVSVEASPRNAALLRASVAANGWDQDRLRVVQAGVSDRPGTLEFCPQGPYGHVSVPADGTAGIQVPAVTLDDLLAEIGWDRVDFIKMDIEGSEIAALGGMIRLLSSGDAPPIFYESNGHTLGFYGQTPRTLKSALERQGYHNYLVEPNRLTKVRAEDLQPKVCVDYLAVKSPLTRLGERRIEPSPSPQEVLEDLLASCASAAYEERVHAVRVLAEASAEIRSHPRVARALESLWSDPSEAVRAEAAARLEAGKPLRTSPWKRWASRLARVRQAGGEPPRAGRLSLRRFGRLKRRIYALLNVANELEQLHREQRETYARQEALLHETLAHLQRAVDETLSSVKAGRLQAGEAFERTRQTLGRIETRQTGLHFNPDLRANEFLVYSQFGEDGILQFLFRHIAIEPENRRFVEFGAEDYRECCTRFLLVNDRWSGFVMDGSPENVDRIKADHAYWFYDLKAAAAFVTAENIDQILSDNGVTGEIGLLVIDIDGNDYWVWEAISVVCPVVVVIEYNYRFGAEEALVVPYDPAFNKETAHPTGIYYGASLKALCSLAERKGYAFVGCSGGGVNAFFVRRDKLPDRIPEVSVEDGYVAGQHAEVRDVENDASVNGIRLVKMPLEEQKALLMGLPLVRVDAVPRAAGESGAR